MKGKLEIQRLTRNGKPALRVIVRGNVGQENRDKLDILGITPATDMSNCREAIISNCREAIISGAAELEALRDALIEQGIVGMPSK